MAVLAAGITAALAQPGSVLQPGQSNQDIVSEVDSSVVTQVNEGNSSDVDTSNIPSSAADNQNNAIRGQLEPNMARERVNTRIVPYRFVGFLRCADGTRCSAALISAHHVLTAGHCVFDYTGTHQLRDPHPRFWPALNNNSSAITPAQEPYGVFTVANISLPPQFTARDTDQAFDLAVLTLSKPVTAVGGYFDYDCFTATDLAPGGEAAEGAPGSQPPPPPPPPPPAPTQVAFRLNVAGYPASSDREMFAAFCDNVTFDISADVLVQHECNTYSGMSGSPLWEYEPASQTRRICAVHKADALVQGVENLAVPLYSRAVDFINQAVAGAAPPEGTPVLADSQG